MRKRVKGYAANPLIIGAVCLVVGVAVGVGGTLYFMSQHQGGLGDGEDIAMENESAAVTEVIPDVTETVTEETTEAPSTEAITENLSYVKIIVSGSDYIYKDEPYTLDAVLAIVRTNADLEVRIVNDGASKHAYDELIGALDRLHDELNVEYHTSKK